MLYSLEVEKQFLAGLIQHPEAYSEICDFVSESDFYSEDTIVHKTIYHIIRKCLEGNEKVDEIIIAQRIKEIGIRKALGARRLDIFLQFLIEAILISILGGMVGIILGLSFGNVVATFLEQEPVIPYEWVFYSLQICASMGIIFGLYPAIKASKLNPIDSMRYD